MNKAKIISVINQKGGVGKTTTCSNVGVYLAKRGRRVLIVDADPQGNATSGLGINKNQVGSLYDVLLNKVEIKKVIQKTNTKNLDIVPANSRLGSAEIELAAMEGRESILARFLDLDYDIILIDCPPSLGLLTINALTASDGVIVPVQAEYYALEGLSQLLQLIQQVKHTLNTKLEIIGVVVTMFDRRNSLSEHVYNELHKHFGAKLFTTVIPRNVRLAEAPSYGKSIAEHDKWSKGARAYKSLAKEVDERV